MVHARRFVLARRPRGLVSVDDFALEEVELTAGGQGSMLLETVWVSLDPAIRGWLDDRPSYLPPVQVGAPVRSLGLARVLDSTLDGFPAGRLVRGFVGWQDRLVVTDPSGWEPIDEPDDGALSHRLGVLGMTGLTAWVGMMDIVRPRPGETVVVSAAAGAVGSVAAQLARHAGARVVGIAGGPAKGRLLRETLGVDAVVDYRAPDWVDQLAAASPDGIDASFENVGGAVMEAVIDRLNNHARVALCGLIDGYNMDVRPPGPANFGQLLTKRVRLEGLVVVDHFARAGVVEAQLAELVASGAITPLETVVEGFDAISSAFVASFAGGHVGKLVVRLHP